MIPIPHYPSRSVTEEILRRGEAEILRLTNNASNNNAAPSNNAAAANAVAGAPVAPEVVNNDNNNNNAPVARATTFSDRSRGARGGVANPVDAAIAAEAAVENQQGVPNNMTAIHNEAMLQLFGTFHHDAQRERRSEHRNVVQAGAPSRGEHRAQDFGGSVLETTRFGRNLIPPIGNRSVSGGDLFSSLLDSSPHLAVARNTNADANNNSAAVPASAVNATEGDAVPGNNNSNNNNGSEREERRVRRRT